MRISAPTIEGGQNSDSGRQIVQLPAGLYGGMFSWYSEPKEYAKYQSSETETKFFVGFVITHDRMNRQLPHFGSAITGVRPKRFWDPEKQMASTYVSLLFALQAGKISKDDICAMPESELPDLDDLIGRPVQLIIKPHAKPGKDGTIGCGIESMAPVDRELFAAMRTLYDARQIKHNDNGLARLVEPAPSFEDEIEERVQNDSYDYAEEEAIPF